MTRKARSKPVTPRAVALPSDEVLDPPPAPVPVVRKGKGAPDAYPWIHPDLRHLARPIAELVPHPRNARRHSERNLATIRASLSDHGQVRAAVVTARAMILGRKKAPAGTVLIGNGMLAAAQALEWTHLACLPFDGVARKAQALALRDNRTAELAEWDADTLAEDLALLRDDGEDLAALGWDPADLSALLGEEEPDGAGEDPGAQVDRAAELQAKWGTALGQLWEIPSLTAPGRAHRLLCGDCRRAEDVARLLGGVRPTLAFTSPPYASQRAYDDKSEFRPIPPDQYVEWFEQVQANVRKHLSADGSWCVNIKEHAEDGERHLYVKDLVIAHKRRWDWLFVDELCWVRAGVPGGWPNRFKNAWEPVFHFAAQAQIKFRPEAVSHETKHAFDYSPANGKSISGSGLLGKEHAAGFREGLARPGNVIEVGSGGAKVTGNHPAEFPVGLPEFFIRAFSDPGDAVYEPFAGSGTTLVAAEGTARASYGMEISPRYVAVILERLAGMGLEPRRIEGPQP